MTPDFPRPGAPPPGVPTGAAAPPTPPTPPPFRVTLARVLAVQVVSLVVLWLLQVTFTR